MVPDFSASGKVQDVLAHEIPANDDSPIQGLSAHHYHTLHTGSGLSDEVIKARGYRTCTGHSELKSLGITVQKATHATGLLLPLHGVDGRPVPVTLPKEQRQIPFTVYRPDTPQFEADGKARKYFAPMGAGTHIDCPPASQAALGDPTVPLWITEGQKKADALASHGACVLAILGVWNWRGENDRGGLTALAEWEYVALNNRQVRIVFDSDVIRKKQVHSALKRLKSLLRHRGAIVSIATLPDDGAGKTGVDDYLLDYTLADLQSLLAPEVDPRQAEQPDTPAAAMGLKLGKFDRPLPILRNVMVVLEADEHWGGGSFKYNKLKNHVEVHWLPEDFPQREGLPRQLRDSDLGEIVAWLSERYDLHASTGTVQEAIQTLARRYAYHPVHDYLGVLKWDGSPRLDTWLIRLAHCDDTPYTRAVGSKFLIGAVARTLDPGCKMDYVLILQGDQGFQKSEAHATLFSSEFYNESLPHDLASKDAVQATMGTWAGELAEMSQFKRSEVTAIKDFITRRNDDIRLPYGRNSERYPRQCVFTGTVNTDTFLRDETGNRRFWPVKVHHRCDLDGIRNERDQLWAEAVVRYRAGEKWYLEGELESIAEQEQAKRMTVDPWASDVADYLERTVLRTVTYHGVSTVFTTTEEIMGDALNIEVGRRDMSQALRVASVLRLLGWRSVKVENPDKASKTRQVRAYVPQEAETGETGGNLEPVSSADPHKYSSETGETGETGIKDDQGSKEEREEGRDHRGATSSTSSTTSDAPLYGKLPVSPVLPVSEPVTSNNSSANSETGLKSNLSQTPGNLSQTPAQPSEGSPAPSTLTDKDPCPHCRGRLKFFKPGIVYCEKQTAIKYLTTWQG